MIETKIINGFKVHPIGIGTWQMGGGLFEDRTAFANYEQDQSEIKAIRYALSLGQNHIDTAQFYGAGHTEEIVGQAIAGFDRAKIFLASKIWKSHATRKAVPHAVEQMLKRLNTSYLDLLYIHAPWAEVSVDECLLGICDAIDLGLVKALGVSNFNAQQMRSALAASRHGVAANQIHYNLLDRVRFTDELRVICEKEKAALVAYQPLERKKLTDQSSNENLVKLAGKCGVTVSQLALYWLIAQKGVVAIPKASRIEHIEENIGAMKIDVDPSVLDELNGIITY
jgi:diketogulonate reductase-like aldo/keto reductase